MKGQSEGVAGGITGQSGSGLAAAASSVARFLNFRLDRNGRRLERDQQLIELEPKGFDMLDYLLRHRDRVVSKAELMDILWPDAVVTASSLTTCAAKVRRALG